MDIINGLSSAAKVLREADKIEQYQQILEAQKTLLDYQKRISELEEENKRLKDISFFKKTAKFNNNCYWLEIENGKIDGPFCSKCVESDNQIIRLHTRHSDGYANCPDCKNHVWSRGEPSPYFSEGESFFGNPAE